MQVYQLHVKRCKYISLNIVVSVIIKKFSERQTMNKYFILMGDIKNSRKMNSEKLSNILNKVIINAEDKFKNSEDRIPNYIDC